MCSENSALEEVVLMFRRQEDYGRMLIVDVLVTTVSTNQITDDKGYMPRGNITQIGALLTHLKTKAHKNCYCNHSLYTVNWQYYI